jgi:hypothetical protein
MGYALVHSSSDPAMIVQRENMSRYLQRACLVQKAGRRLERIVIGTYLLAAMGLQDILDCARHACRDSTPMAID